MADKQTFSLATDSMALDASGITESDGIISVPATVAKHMVQDYDGLKVLKPAEELEAAAKYADGIPVTRDHPSAGIVTDRGEVLGFLKDPLFENDELKGILQISNKDLATDIKDGKLKELSIGFFCDLDRTEGAVGDAKYDAIQKNIFLNHVAVVDAGRCSLEDGCGIHTDSPATKHTDDASAIATITAERDALKAELEKIVKTEKDTIIAELTAIQDAKTKDDLEKLDLVNLKKELDMVNELRTDHLTFTKEHGSGGKSAIDDAYGNVGR